MGMPQETFLVVVAVLMLLLVVTERFARPKVGPTIDPLPPPPRRPRKRVRGLSDPNRLPED